MVSKARDWIVLAAIGLGLAVSGVAAIPALAAELTVGDSFKDCEICPEMVVVPAGTFMMGSPASEEGHTRDETPLHEVKIGQAFAAGAYEVTRAEWAACVADGECTGLDAEDGTELLPAVGMSWEEAQAYVAWLSRQTGQTYRLLSEAEWEYAARAGTDTAYHTGTTLTADQANVADAAGGGKSTGFSVAVAPAKSLGTVGGFPPNDFGLYDVHGNVWEWAEDCVNDGYVGAPQDGSVWATGKCERRIIRGGSWVDFPVGARSAIRSGLATDGRGRTLGLRVARTLD